ncbi:MAG: PAS domain-containing protein [Thalassobaculum sp.]|uniref:PAS domain-containing protein n=1 Tax=Thalassobaculum sp. TaxID=2022740 RepID=UPI0032EF24BA
MPGTSGILDGVVITEDRSRAFAEYWEALPKFDLIPRRDAFRPEEVPRLLPNMVIHELVSPEMLRLRLVGSAVIEDYGQEITGRNYLDFVDEARRPKASRAIFEVCEHPAGMLVQLRSVTRAGRILTRESIAFPMRGDGDVANLVYFCSSPARERDYTTAEGDHLKIMNVMQRFYIDIGAGRPDFRD